MVTGARQIGKTTLVRHFGNTQYGCFAELNFLEDEQAKLIFEGPLDADRLISSLTAYLKKPLVPGDTLILLDEIQECPRARTAIKFLVEDGRFDYMETGSLLGVKTKDVASYPVGFEHYLRMYPLDFEEFCIANGVQKSTLALLRKRFDEKVPVEDSIHDSMMRLFYVYLVVGGMPEVVQRYIETHDIAQVVQLQESLLASYRLDIAKYAGSQEKVKIRSIFDAIPSQLDDKNRRFVVADLGKEARYRRYESSFLWLADARVALPCYNVAEPKVPLAANEKYSLFRLFMSDCGFLSASFLGNSQLNLLNGNLEANMGAVMENVVAQELKAHGFSLCYFNSKKLGEVDFVIQRGNKVVPIEVKSGNDWAKHKALDNVLGVGEWDISESYVVCKGNVKRSGSVTYIPLYTIMFIQQEKLPKQLIYEPNLSVL